MSFDATRLLRYYVNTISSGSVKARMKANLSVQVKPQTGLLSAEYMTGIQNRPLDIRWNSMQTSLPHIGVELAVNCRCTDHRSCFNQQ